MYYAPELQMLQNTLRKCRIQSTLLDLSMPLGSLSDIPIHTYLRRHIPQELSLQQILPPVREATIYRISDPLACRYIFILLPETSRQSILLIGPYITQVPTQTELLELAERNNIPPVHTADMEKFYGNIPLLPQTSHLFAMLEVFCEKLWGNSFVLEDIDRAQTVIPRLPDPEKSDDDSSNLIWNMRNMERRYQYENDIMDAVTHGQSHKADLLLSNFSSLSFEQRLSDPMRNLKNYCIIMNTLLRKAAERGGVHPVYLDSTSSAFAVQIDQLSTTDAVVPKMLEIFRAYCHLVQKHAVQNYSPPVQKAIICIDMDLTGNLNLRSLSQAMNISGSYLSTLFKKETGVTITEYINSRRVNYAKHLLESTQLQIQTVAQHCGIMDIHYFSKVFKKVTGMTPREYRLNGKKYT